MNPEAEIEGYSDKICRDALAVLDVRSLPPGAAVGLTLDDIHPLMRLGLVRHVVEDQEYYLPTDRLLKLAGAMRRRLGLPERTQWYRLILDLEIAPREASSGELKNKLRKAVREFMDIGPLPEDSPASIEDWGANIVELENKPGKCIFCTRPYGPGAHVHQQGMVCENCWDERLRMTQ